MNYNDAEIILARSRRDKKKLAGNTWLIRRGETFVIRFHNTDIVVIHKDGRYTLQTGGYRTATTKRRIREYTPANLYQEAFEWYIGPIPFFDGIEIDRLGAVLNDA